MNKQSISIGISQNGYKMKLTIIKLYRQQLSSLHLYLPIRLKLNQFHATSTVRKSYKLKLTTQKHFKPLADRAK